VQSGKYAIFSPLRGKRKECQRQHRTIVPASLSRLFAHFFSLKNEKYCAAVASTSWLTDEAYPLRVHTVFLRFPNFELGQKSRLSLLVKLCGVAQNLTHRHLRMFVVRCLGMKFYTSF
jgi:hypothetical protein